MAYANSHRFVNSDNDEKGSQGKNNDVPEFHRKYLNQVILLQQIRLRDFRFDRLKDPGQRQGRYHK